MLKLIFFDMEGTIFKKAVPLNKTNVAPSAWYLIAEGLGPEALKEEKKTQDKSNNGKYSGYIEWMEETIMIHKKYRLTREIFFKVIDSIDYNNGVKEVFSKINNKNIPTCLISGGFKNQADKAVRDLKIKHSFIACEYFWDKDGLLYHWNLLPGDNQGKLAFMKMLIAEYGISNANCAFVGDGDNDVTIAKEVGISIAFNAQEKLRQVATYSIEQPDGSEDFKSILKYLDM